MQANILFAYQKTIYQINENMNPLFLNQFHMQILLQMIIKKNKSMSIVK